MWVDPKIVDNYNSAAWHIINQYGYFELVQHIKEEPKGFFGNVVSSLKAATMAKIPEFRVYYCSPNNISRYIIAESETEEGILKNWNFVSEHIARKAEEMKSGLSAKEKETILNDFVILKVQSLVHSESDNEEYQNSEAVVNQFHQQFPQFVDEKLITSYTCSLTQSGKLFRGTAFLTRKYIFLHL